MNALKSLGLRYLSVLCLLLPAALPSCSSTLEPLQNTCKNVDCSGHGECKIQGGKAVCVCEEGYSPEGLNCIEEPCREVTCSGHGSCVVQAGQAACECNPGYRAEGLSCVEDVNSCDGIDCSGHGECVIHGAHPSCECDDGYIPNGLNCVDDPCSDENMCTVDTSDPVIGCIHTAVEDSSSCDDGFYCNGTDSCESGECVHSGNPCGIYWCNETTDDCSDKTWYELDGSGSGDGMGFGESPLLTMDGFGNPVLAMVQSGVGSEIFITRYNGESWDNSWSNLHVVHDGPGAMAFDDNNNLVIAYDADCGYRCCCLTVSRHDGSEWIELGDCSESFPGWVLDGFSFALDSLGNPVLAWNGPSIYIKRYDGTNWVDVGTGSATGSGVIDNEEWMYPTLALDSNDVPFIVYRNVNFELRVKRFYEQSDSWIRVGEDFSPQGEYHSLIIDDDDRPILAWTDMSSFPHPLYIRKFDGTEWVEIGEGSATGGGVSNNDGHAQTPSLGLDSNGNPVVAWYYCTWDPEVTQIYVKRFDPNISGGAWVEFGVGSASGGGISNSTEHAFSSFIPSLAAGGGLICVAWDEDRRYEEPWLRVMLRCADE